MFSTGTVDSTPQPIDESIGNALFGYCRQIIANPKSLMAGEYPRFKIYSPSPFSSIPFHRSSKIIDEMQKIIPSILEYVSQVDLPDDDFVFLLRLGQKRNWRAGCAICLTDEMMGTTCGCGHTEIAIFKPCGHSMCVNPCFEKFMKSFNLELPTATFESGGKKFYIPSKKDITKCNGFSCPLCRTIVTQTFRAEDVFLPKMVKETAEFQNAVKKIIETCWSN